MIYHTHQSLIERLRAVINLSFKLLSNKIANKEIEIYNEASMQLQLGAIMQQLALLFKYSPNERFAVELEVSEKINCTQKSSRGNARCDVRLTLTDGIQKADAFIELKYLKKEDNEAVTDNKFFVYCDIENLESYKKNNPDRLCYEFVYTNNANYTHKNKYKFCIGDKHKILAKRYEYTKQRDVSLSNNYDLEWNEYKSSSEDDIGHYFLQIDLDK